MISNKEYKEGVLRTESCDFEAIRKRMSSEEAIRLTHATDGICTEAGEIKDALKKYIFYGKELDKVNLIEELGDLYWYINIAQDVLGVTTEEVQQRNNAKLRARYGEKFTEEAAINRNLEIEKKALQGE